MWLGNAANPKCGEKMKTSTKDNAGGSATFNETFNFQKAENMNLLTVSRATITTHDTLVKKRLLSTCGCNSQIAQADCRVISCPRHPDTNPN
jgi:hypothetical protein